MPTLLSFRPFIGLDPGAKQQAMVGKHVSTLQNHQPLVFSVQNDTKGGKRFEEFSAGVGHVEWLGKIPSFNDWFASKPIVEGGEIVIGTTTRAQNFSAGGTTADGESFVLNLNDSDIQTANRFEGNKTAAENSNMDWGALLQTSKDRQSSNRQLVNGAPPPASDFIENPIGQVPALPAPRGEGSIRLPGTVDSGPTIIPSVPQSQALVPSRPHAMVSMESGGDEQMDHTGQQMVMRPQYSVTNTAQSQHQLSIQMLLQSGLQATFDFNSRLERGQEQLDSLVDIIVSQQTERSEIITDAQRRAREMLSAEQARMTVEANEYIGVLQANFSRLLEDARASNQMLQVESAETATEAAKSIGLLTQAAQEQSMASTQKVADLNQARRELMAKSDLKVRELQEELRRESEQRTQAERALSEQEKRTQEVLLAGRKLLRQTDATGAEKDTQISQLLSALEESRSRVEAVSRELVEERERRAESGQAAAASPEGEPPSRPPDRAPSDPGPSDGPSQSREKDVVMEDKQPPPGDTEMPFTRSQAAAQPPAEELDVEAEEGASSWTQKPRNYFDVHRLKRFLHPEKGLPSIVGSDIRRFQQHNAFRIEPWHGRHLQNITVKV